MSTARGGSRRTVHVRSFFAVCRPIVNYFSPVSQRSMESGNGQKQRVNSDSRKSNGRMQNCKISGVNSAVKFPSSGICLYRKSGLNRHQRDPDSFVVRIPGTLLESSPIKYCPLFNHVCCYISRPRLGDIGHLCLGHRRPPDNHGGAFVVVACGAQCETRHPSSLCQFKPLPYSPAGP